ncbi:MAG: DUF4040 domain-containing protein [Candidatus Omnitrophica bacterium]|nr:DUF4040 domain-containing protein [Candidatus Omnitrophota bacterium]
MICAATAAVMMEDLLSSLIALSAAGLGLSLAFLILKAPNLAITQLVVEILCIIILIRATINKDIFLVKDGRWFFNTVSTLSFISFFLILSWFALKELPRFGEPLLVVAGRYLEEAAATAHSANIVSAITLFFRNFDALGEAVVIFTALIGVLVIARRVAKVEKNDK